MNEATLLAWLGIHQNYSRYYTFINAGSLTYQVGEVFKALESWYEDNPSDIDWEKFRVWYLTVKNPRLNKEQSDIIRRFLELVGECEDELGPEILKVFIGREYAARMGDIANRVAEGEEIENLQDVADLYREYEREAGLTNVHDAYLVDGTLVDLLDPKTLGTGYQWRLDELNVSLGNLRRGDFITVGSRPDAGKTTFLCSEASHILTQLDSGQTITWFCNEEHGSKVKTRLLGAVLGWTLRDIKKDPVAAHEEVIRLHPNIYNQLKIYYNLGMNTKFVERILDNTNPGLIVIDQLRKIHCKTRTNNDVQQLQYLYSWARELSWRAPVLNVHQVDITGEGVKWLNQGQFYGSKTDIQGECDALVMIGRTLEIAKLGDEKIRYLHIPKNKMGNDSHCEEKFRNGKFEVTIQPEVGRYKGVMKLA